MNKTFNIITAYDKHRGIGYLNKLPWKHNKTDMNFFNKTTTTTDYSYMKNAVIMGHNTWESLPDTFKPLPDRHNIILSSKMHTPYTPNTEYSTNFDDAIDSAIKNPLINKVFVIGGEQVYKHAIRHDLCDTIYVTEFPDSYKTDTKFPKIPCWMKCVKETVENDLKFKVFKNMKDPGSPEYKYLEMVEDILHNGEEINDRTGVGTLSVFDRNLNYPIETLNPDESDVLKLEYRIPLFTTKKVNFHSAVTELIWMINGITDTRWLTDRGVHIWDGHTSREHLDNMGLYDYPEGELGPGYGKQWVNWNGINQITEIIELLKKDPTSRRAVMTGWNVSDLSKMALPPCHMTYVFKVTNHNDIKSRLNCKVLLRSNDLFLGHPFNTVNTAVLTILMSRILNMLPGEISLSIVDAHIYKDHKEQVAKQITRDPIEFPTICINKDINTWEDMCNLSSDDFNLRDYLRYPFINAKMAI